MLALLGGILAFSHTATAFPRADNAVGKLAFVKDMDIWTANADGSNLKRLTTAPGLDLSPSWSPDGTKIAFSSNRDGDMEIFVMNADGSNERQLTFDEVGDDRHASWTPDGQHLFYDKFFNVIYEINIDGGGGQQFIRNDAADAAVSSDGSKLVFVDQIDFGLYTMNPDGTGVEFITNPGGGGTLDPEWSPDGANLAFVCAPDPPHATNDLCTSRSDGTGVNHIVNTSDRNEFSPTWSPNGKKIAFIQCTLDVTDRVCQIDVMKQDGTHMRQLPISGVGPNLSKGVDWQPISED
jgi:Tol biopolymer transport system component